MVFPQKEKPYTINLAEGCLPKDTWSRDFLSLADVPTQFPDDDFSQGKFWLIFCEVFGWQGNKNVV